MSKKTALIVFTFFDLLALYGLWLGYGEINKIVTGVANCADSVSFNSKIGLSMIAIIIPTAHFYGFCECFFFQNVLPKIETLVSRAFITLTIVSFAGAIFISFYMQSYVKRAGYVHCSELDEELSFSVHLMYTKDSETCGQLVAEDRKKKGLDP